MTSVLIVEDELHLAEGLRFNLAAEGYQVDVVSEGEKALEILALRPDEYDAILLDVMLPGIDGFTVAARLRDAGNFVPVLMLTARGRPEDVLKGFEAGADDYLPKPFELAILVARLHGLIRRSQWHKRVDNTEVEAEAQVDGVSDEVLKSRAGDVFKFANREIDFGALELRGRGKPVQLTLMEAELLRYLVTHAGRVVSRKSILEEVWNLKVDTDTRAIDNFIVRLRRYIEDDPSKPLFLVTVRGVGYRFVPNP
jgi:DNA-binding response OmpR family regulator